MVPRIRRIALFLREKRVPVLILTVAFSLVTGAFSLQSRVDNSLPVWQSEDDPHWHHYQQFRKNNSITDPLIIYLPVTEQDELHRLRDSLREETETGVFGFMEKGKGDERKGVLFLKPAPDLEPEQLADLLQAAKKVLKRAKIRYHLGGVWYMTAMLDSYSARSTQTLFPVVILILSLGVWITIRQKNNVVLVLSCGLLPALQIVGIMAMVGVKLNMVLLALPPMTMILGTAYAIHLAAKVPDNEGQTGPDLFAIVAPPCVLSGVTTSLGFLSLTLSSYSPVRQLGVWGAISTFLSLINALVLLAAYFKPAVRQPYSISPTLSRTLHRFRYPFLLLFICCGFAGSLGLGKLDSGTLILDFFEDKAEVRQHYHAIESEGIGLTPFEIDLEGCKKDKLEVQTALNDFATRYQVFTHFFYFFESGQVAVEATDGGMKIDSPLDFNYVFSKPRRVTALLQTLSSEETLRLAETLNQSLAKVLGPLSHPYVTGAVPLYARGQKALFSSMLQSFGFAFLSISIIIGLALRSLRYGLIAIIPNILPVFFILAAMGWLQIPLSVSTVTVASIVLGIVVDDSIHFLHRLRGETGSNMINRLQNSLDHVGPAIIITSLVAGCGFLGFYVSPFIPLRDFGLIIAGSLILALICDLFLLPVLLLIRSQNHE